MSIYYFDVCVNFWQYFYYYYHYDTRSRSSHGNRLADTPAAVIIIIIFMNAFFLYFYKSFIVKDRVFKLKLVSPLNPESYFFVSVT